MTRDGAYFPMNGGPEALPPRTDAEPSVREQAYEIIEAILLGTDPEGAEVRKRLGEHVDAYPGRPETALQEHLIFTRSLARKPGGPNPRTLAGLIPQDAPKAGSRRGSKSQSPSSIESIISNRMLVTAFQPVFELATRNVVGAEALTRFISEDGDRAHAWFDGAAAAGLDVPLEIAALESAVQSMQQLPRHLYVVLNISPATCRDPRLPTLLKQVNRPANRVVLELTRNFTAAELESVIAALEPLRRSGLRLTVNDAGPDAASMRHIRTLRPDFIKLDRRLIAGIEEDPGLQDLVKDMVEFGRLTGARLVAVGIETEAELIAVTRLGMTVGQGYYLGRPTMHSRDWSSWTAGPRRRIRLRAGAVTGSFD